MIPLRCETSLYAWRREDYEHFYGFEKIYPFCVVPIVLNQTDDNHLQENCDSLNSGCLVD